MKRFLSSILMLCALTLTAVPLFAQDGKRVDWYGKIDGEPEIPGWLKSMRRGNGLAYCQENGLNNKINRKWIVPTAAESNIGWEDGLIAARADTMASLGEAIATDILASTKTSNANGSKDRVRKIVLESVTSISGLEFEGYHWYEIEKEVKVGENKKGKPVMQKSRVWYVYAFYSIDYESYNKQMLTAMYKVNLAAGLSPDEAKKVTATSWQEVVSLQNNQEAHDRAVKEEQDRQVLNHKQSLENRQMSMDEKGQDYQYNIDNRNIDTQQLQIRETTKQMENKNRAETKQNQDTSSANVTSSIASPDTGSGALNTGDVVSDAMAFLLSL